MKVVTVQNIQALYAQGYRLLHLTRDWIFEAHAKITWAIEGYLVEVGEGEAKAFLPKDIVADLWRKALADPSMKEVFMMVAPTDWVKWVQLAKKEDLRRAEEARVADEQAKAHGKDGTVQQPTGYVPGLLPHPFYDTHGNYRSGGSGYGGGGPGGSGIH